MVKSPAGWARMNPDRTGRTLRELRAARGLSLRELASLVNYSHQGLGHIETGLRWPADRGWIEQVDLALQGEGRLIAAWDEDQRERAKATDTVRMLDRARQESQQLLVAPDGVTLDELHHGIINVAKAARFESYDATLAQALGIRAELLRRLNQVAYSPDDSRDLYVALGRTCGILAYLTLDLGQAEVARVHAQAAFRLGDRADHDQLRAWSRGTQALAFRFTKDFELARDAAQDGLNYIGTSTGTMGSRLLCGLAASIANLGDSARALELLEDADRMRDSSGPDEIPGLFSFSEAKQIYYHGFSLMWADDDKTLRKSIKASQEALDAWHVQRSPGDEMLSTIYLSMANARLGDLDGSLAAVAPVLETPIEAHFSWVRKRLNQLDGLLGENFPDSKVASDMQKTLKAYVHAR